MPYTDNETKTVIEIIDGKEVGKEVPVLKYKSLLIKESDNTYMGWEPTRNPDPNKPDIGSGMYEVKDWNKPLPDDIDTAHDENGNSLYKYENGELKAV